MNAREFFERVATLERGNAAFAVAMVIDRRAPVSSHLGDRAIVFADGRMEGFVGGSCSRDIVRRQAVDAMRAGKPRLVQIDPGGVPARAGSETETFVVPMGCASEGGVNVYIEPHLPPRLLVVVGHSPVADQLVRLSSSLERYRVVRVVSDEELGDIPVSSIRTVALGSLRSLVAELEPAERRRLVAVVASQGHYDESALETLLTGEPAAFVGLLASRKRGADVFGILRQQGIAADRIASIRNPVGLDIGARDPGEVAVSILAEIVSATAPFDPLPAAAPAQPDLAVDPVCEMQVEIAGAAHRAQHDGREYYFCCAHCRATFLAEPKQYAGAGLPG
jgi:xanthine dehydrogenase accessory factor